MMKKEKTELRAYTCPLTQIIHINFDQQLLTSSDEGDHNSAPDDDDEPTPISQDNNDFYGQG